MRRFMGGAIWGAIVGVLGLGVISQMAPVPGAGGPVVADAPAAAPVVKDTAVAQPPVVASPVAAPAAVAPTISADAPLQADVPDVTDAGSPAVTAEAPANAVPSAPLTLPDVEAAPVVAQAPAQPPAAPPTVAPAAQVTPDAVAAPLAPAADAPVVTAGLATPATPAADAAPAMADLPPPPPLTTEEQALLDAAMAGAVPLDPVTSPVIPAATPVVVADGATVPAPKVEPAQMTAPVAEPAPVEDAATLPPEPALVATGIIADQAPSTLTPTPPLGTEGAVTQRRLAQVDAPVEAVEPLPAADRSDEPPLVRYAAAFENPDAKPLFSLVLIDDGAVDTDRQTLANLPFAVSFVLDPLSPGAANAAATYRAGGKEVLMLATGIPEGATPADLEQTFQAHAAALPEAVAVIDLAEAGLQGAGFQGDRALATQLVPILAAQGRGLLTWDRGLNAADQVARREALPTAMVFRALDAEGEDAPLIRRYLDRAAFKAAQEGAVTVVGHTRPDTIAAVLEWAVEGRAASVALAPVSAVLAGP